MIYEVKWSSKFKKGYKLAKYRNSGLRAGVFLFHLDVILWQIASL